MNFLKKFTALILVVSREMFDTQSTHRRVAIDPTIHFPIRRRGTWNRPNRSWVILLVAMPNTNQLRPSSLPFRDIPHLDSDKISIRPDYHFYQSLHRGCIKSLSARETRLRQRKAFDWLIDWLMNRPMIETYVYVPCCSWMDLPRVWVVDNVSGHGRWWDSTTWFRIGPCPHNSHRRWTDWHVRPTRSTWCYYCGQNRSFHYRLDPSDWCQ